MEQLIGLIIQVETEKKEAYNQAAHFCSSNQLVVNSPCFNTDTYYTGQAINISHHSGEEKRGIIAECTKDWIKAYSVDKLGNAITIEIELQDYINGAWIINIL